MTRKLHFVPTTVAAALAVLLAAPALAVTCQIRQAAPGMVAPPSSCSLPWGGAR